MTKIQQLYKLGQSVWLDYISRGFINSNGLKHMIDLGIHGVTSNPTIFEKAISDSSDYDADIHKLAREGKSTLEIYNCLTIDDIQRAADLFLPIYSESGENDGFVSLEVNPRFANDTQRTLAEAKNLWATVDRPNLMIKIPATKKGLPAIRQTIAAGINVNVTLIFSISRYKEVIAAYLEGLQERFNNNQPVDNIASVASFFVSRMDTKVDQLLQNKIQVDEIKAADAQSIMGKSAIANTKLAYQEFLKTFEKEPFQALKKAGAKLQRPLWASTSTKNPQYSDILYIQELIAANSVNTAPQETINAFMDHGFARMTIQDNLQEASEVMERLSELRISMDKVTELLEKEGVNSFTNSFDRLMESLEQKRSQVL